MPLPDLWLGRRCVCGRLEKKDLGGLTRARIRPRGYGIGGQLAAKTPCGQEGLFHGRPNVLRSILRAAEESGLIARSPCIGIDLPPLHKSEQHFLEEDEVLRLAEEITPRHRALILTGAYLGLRWGELAGLLKQQIRFLERRLDVVETITELSGRLLGGPPKTGQRSILMSGSSPMCSQSSWHGSRIRTATHSPPLAEGRLGGPTSCGGTFGPRRPARTSYLSICTTSGTRRRPWPSLAALTRWKSRSSSGMQACARRSTCTDTSFPLWESDSPRPRTRDSERRALRVRNGCGTVRPIGRRRSPLCALHWLRGAAFQWALVVSNHRPPPCKGGALPLS
jgi:hypothetical protein